MLEVLEKLLVLQDRDRKISAVQSELNKIGPERDAFTARLTHAQSELEAAKLRVKQIETERKKFELDVEAKKQQIEKYSLQQYQTKKNDEYRALANEIEMCKGAIREIEDRELDVMEKGEAAQREVTVATQVTAETKKTVEMLTADLTVREKNLRAQLSGLESDYGVLMGAVEEGVLARYQRLRKSKGNNLLVGIEHSVCGGCHMKLPVQIVISCQAEKDIMSCPNCGRFLYYTPHMDLAVAE